MLCAVAAAGCGHDAPPAPADIRPVRAEQVGRHADERGTRYSGEVRARHETDLAFRVGGRVQTRDVEVGTAVRGGQRIATLDAGDYALGAAAAQAQQAAAAAEARLAREDLQRYAALRARNFISQAEFDRRQTTAEAAEARLRQAIADARLQDNQQAYTRLDAPHAGVVTALAVEAGQVVAAGQTVAQLARSGEREVRIDVPENALDALHAAKTLTVRLWATPGATYAGRLRELSPAADAASRTYRARVSVLQPDAAVRLGATATVEVAAGAAPELSVAQSALFRVNGQPQVWVVDERSHTIAARSVRLGALRANRAVVVSGLRAGEWVVTAGVHKILPGQRVRQVQAGRAAPDAP
jgi:multidrug efflux system membrane fusion protein